jgi:vitamin B12 transporter
MAVVMRCLWAAALPSALVTGAYAQSSPTPDFVVTATRTPQAISRAGSAITVITAEEIVKESPKDIANLLRRVPGLTLTQAGGAGAVTNVRLRGADAKHTLVLIDGVRVNDPSTGSSEFDFSNIVLTDIERIEVLRGPQSALYGSDAMGGVINIITRKGKGAPRILASTEAGSYGSKGLSVGISGSTGPLSYAFSLAGYDSAGFSRYGYRIGRIEHRRAWPLEADASRRLGATGRVGIALSDTTELEFGGYASLNKGQYDGAFGTYPDTPAVSEQELAEGYTRLTALAFDGILRNTVLVSANRTARDYRDYSFSGLPVRMSGTESGYVGNRWGAEYQGDLNLGSFGLLTFGTKYEQERLRTTSRGLLPIPGPSTETNDASQATASAFAIHQISLWDHLHLSLGGRIDQIQNGERFATWRATAAYELPQTATTLRTSIGTGAKAPTLFQLYDPTYGTPGLQPEHSLGYDVGIDQRLWDDRVILSATLFSNRFRDLIEFVSGPTCPPTTPFGCYRNVARARTSGLELSADVDIVPSWLRLKAVYTYLEAVDAITHKRLARRPEQEGRIGLVLTPAPGLSIEPSVVLVGKRFSSSGERDKLDPYARFDILADYKINDTFSVFARVENITDAKYEEVRNYGTAGRSFYAGIRATW